MTKFEEQFFSGENIKYLNVIRYLNSEYSSSEELLIINFLVDSRDYNKIMSELNEIRERCKSITNIKKTQVKIIRTFTDEQSVINAILQGIKEISNMNTLILDGMSYEDIIVKFIEKKIKCTIKVQQSFFEIFKEKLLDKLKTHLESKFPQEIELVEYMTKDREVGSVEFTQSKAVVAAIRQIPFTCKQKIIGRRNVDNINNTFAEYIRDIKPINQKRIIVCGEITDVNEFQYTPSAEKEKVKQNTSYEPVKKDMLKVKISDTTGIIECTYFLNEQDQKRRGELVVGANIAVDGNVNVYNGRIGITANAFFFADIQYSKINIKKGKVAPKNYLTISPEKYHVEIQGELGRSTEIPESLKNNKFVIFDLETSGLDILKYEIIDFAAVKIIDGRVVEKLESLFNPGAKLDPKVTELTNITDKMLQDKPKIIDAIGDIYKFFDDCIICGHNSDVFDIPFLKKYYEETGYVFNNKTIDTLVLAKKYLRLSSYKLSSIAENFGFASPNAHRALADVEMTYKVLLKIFDEGYVYATK